MPSMLNLDRDWTWLLESIPDRCVLLVVNSSQNDCQALFGVCDCMIRLLQLFIDQSIDEIVLELQFSSG